MAIANNKLDSWAAATGEEAELHFLLTDGGGPLLKDTSGLVGPMFAAKFPYPLPAVSLTVY